jgi:hypothetical protein
MGLLRLIQRLFFSSKSSARSRAPVDRKHARPRKPQLVPLRYDSTELERTPLIETKEPAYRFARFSVVHGGYLDLSTDGDDGLLSGFDLPRFRTPAELADWLSLPLGQVAWLIHRFSERHRPQDAQSAHYHFRWLKKRGGGWRLIESPKQVLKRVQTQILREILDHVPPHELAHGFARGRSIVTNARPHVGSRVLVKLDLENFYATVRFSRVAAIFRSLGYSRDAALWLARLTTSSLPTTLPFPEGEATALRPFLGRHLPQGAPTSPALANLSAYALDVRLGGLARSFGARYTRYADDLTFSGPERFLRSLRTFLPLVGQIVRAERFRVNPRKRRVIRNSQRQTVTGVVVNARVNVSRADYDRLKATLVNCVRQGPAAQNRAGTPDFAAHLCGKIAHVMQLNPDRGNRLLEIYEQIQWNS